MSLRTIIVDESALSFTPPDAWSTVTAPIWYGGAAYAARYANGSDGMVGTVTYTFEGTSIAFTGSTPDEELQQTFVVSIDGEVPTTQTFPAPNYYMPWYTSPTLEYGNHTISLGDLQQVYIDYATVTLPDSETAAVDGKVVLVDSNDESITYSGSGWSENDDLLGHLSRMYVDNVPLGNSTQATSTDGTSFSFTFFGTSVSVYGIRRQSIGGSIAATFSVDDSSPSSLGIVVETDTANDQANSLFYTISSLPEGEHTLVGNITYIRGSQSFRLDYITYTPTNLPPSNTGSTSSGGGSGNTSSGTNTGSGSGTQTENSASGKKSTPVGPIVGGVLGGVALIALLILAWIWYRRARRRREAQITAETRETAARPFIPVGRAAPPSTLPSKLSPISPNTHTANLGAHVTHDPAQTVSSPTSTSPSTSIPRSKGQLASPTLASPTVASPTSPASGSGTASSVLSQQDIVRRLDELNQLLKRSVEPTPSQSSQADTDFLRRRIDELIAENSRLVAIPPPSYS